MEVEYPTNTHTHTHTHTVSHWGEAVREGEQITASTTPVLFRYKPSINYSIFRITDVILEFETGLGKIFKIQK